MSTQNFELAFFTIGHFEHFSDEDTQRTAHLDLPQEHLHIAATLQSARQWLIEQQPQVDMECAAELPMRGYFVFKGTQLDESFHTENAQLVAVEEGFVVRAQLDNGICIETDVLVLNV